MAYGFLDSYMQRFGGRNDLLENLGGYRGFGGNQQQNQQFGMFRSPWQQSQVGYLGGSSTFDEVGGSNNGMNPPQQRQRAPWFGPTNPDPFQRVPRQPEPGGLPDTIGGHTGPDGTIIGGTPRPRPGDPNSPLDSRGVPKPEHMKNFRWNPITQTWEGIIRGF